LNRYVNRNEDKDILRGQKSKYTDKQERKADHITEGYKERGMKEADAKRIAWATVNKQDGGGKKSGGSGRKKQMVLKTKSCFVKVWM